MRQNWLEKGCNLWLSLWKQLKAPHPLTDEEKNMIRKAEAMPIAFDEDCPESTEEMLVQFKKAGEER